MTADVVITGRGAVSPLGTDVPSLLGGLLANQVAVAEAGLAGPGQLDARRTAVVHGTSMGGMRALLRAQHELERSGPGAINRKTVIQIWPNMAAAQIAMRYGLARS